jgi:peptidoglycan hydrolase-like protein with peptidoglycan-binding domain
MDATPEFALPPDDGDRIDLSRLYPWSQGPLVAHLQELLDACGYRLRPDGDFGWITEAAVRDFQRRNSLRVDGIVGDRTWELLLSKVKPGARTMRLGYRGSDVRELQGLLQVHDYRVRRTDGFDRDTQDAVLDFQRSHHLDATGDVTPITWAVMCDGKTVQPPPDRNKWLLERGRWR